MKELNQKSKPTILHLGCGMRKEPKSLGIDINPDSDADIIHDLNIYPYPFKNNQFNQIVAEHILEHLDDIPKVMEELHRITRNNGKIIITGSHFTSTDSFTDPTHKHFFTSRSFDYFIPNTALYNRHHYSNKKFKKIRVIVGPENPTNLILILTLKLINRYLEFYERRFAFIFPVGAIRIELKVVKDI